MAHDAKSELRRALDDMNEGIQAMLGFDASRPELIVELLDGDPGPRARRRSAKHTPRSDRPRARTRRSSVLRLVRGG